MRSWRDMAAEISGHASAARVEKPMPQLAANGVPPELLRGVALLPTFRPRQLTTWSMWDEVVEDAQRLIDSGWAARALALGWSPLDLFGVGPDGSESFEGLAVWLCRRRVLLLDDHSAIASDRRAYGFYNRRVGRAVFLWELGR